jgi:hypothetical protein
MTSWGKENDVSNGNGGRSPTEVLAQVAARHFPAIEPLKLPNNDEERSAHMKEMFAMIAGGGNAKSSKTSRSEASTAAGSMHPSIAGSAASSARSSWSRSYSKENPMNFQCVAAC